MRPHTIASPILMALACTNTVAADSLWQPSDYDGAYVWIIDNASNGCWTNIGEVQQYAEDQLALAGFEVIKKPDSKEDPTHPVLRENIAAYQLHVNASRTDSGMCIGYLNSSFWGAVAPGYDQSKLIVSQIGPPFVWSVWNKENLNQYLFDQVKDTIQDWIDIGVKKANPE